MGASQQCSSIFWWYIVPHLDECWHKCFYDCLIWSLRNTVNADWIPPKEQTWNCPNLENILENKNEYAFFKKEITWISHYILNQPSGNQPLTSITDSVMGVCMFKAQLSAELLASSKQHQHFLWILASRALGTAINTESWSWSSNLFVWQGHSNSHCVVFWLCTQVEMHSLDTQS